MKRANQQTASKIYLAAENKDQLFQLDCQVDQGICGRMLTDPGATRLAKMGAHDPTPTPYFVLDQLFAHFDFDQKSHLLDVGCGLGRALAYFIWQGYPGQASGVELDTELARQAQEWSSRYNNLHVLQGNALDLDLNAYTHFYLFNPFDTNILLQFLATLEAQVDHRITLVHMSDNGETYFYMGRTGWSMVDQGDIQKCRNARGRAFGVYEHPQHFSVWSYQPN